MIPIDGIIFCPPWPIRPKGVPCPGTVEETRFSMDKFDEAPLLPTDEVPDCEGVNPPMGEDLQGTSAGWQPLVEFHGLTAEMDTPGMDTWTDPWTPEMDTAAMSGS